MNGRRLLFVTAVATALSLGSCGAIGIVMATENGIPGEPTSYYGEATDANGTEISAGVVIVAVVNHSVEGEITVDPSGEYGGSGAFDDKLRVDSSVGEEVAFHLVGPNGSVGGTATLEAGITESDLTFPEGSIEKLPPTPTIEIDPDVAKSGDPIAFSASNSTAHDDANIDSFEWWIERDGETIETFDGETSTRSLDASGRYDIVLTVTDTNGRTASETSNVEIEGDETDDSTGSSGGSEVGSVGGGSGGGAGSTGFGESGDSGEASSASTGESGTGDSSDFPRSSREPIFAETHEIEDRFPDASGSAVVFGETAIREIVFENRSDGGEISIEEFEMPINDAPSIPGHPRIASASSIVVPEDHRNSDAILRAVIADEWLTDRDIEPKYLTVYRLPDEGSRWEALPTEAFEIDDGYLVEAETPGFSQFVVAGRKTPSTGGEKAEAAGTETSDDRSEPTASVTSDGEETSESTDPETSTPTETRGFDPTNPIVPLAFLCALLVVVAAIGRLFIPRRRERW